ncbi:uncharacterized protein LOC116410538 [Xenopus tropicalis]|uniref:Uncharacterized protein LOC116410538 n=2 Tax=Xenopus tropicalis TaxID=8364 RepID=A0A8J1JKT4_XENTR|nr:uncharacterized protein LOC116410538 [Xenopus tropicalis]
MVVMILIGLYGIIKFKMHKMVIDAVKWCFTPHKTDDVDEALDEVLTGEDLLKMLKVQDEGSSEKGSDRSGSDESESASGSSESGSNASNSSTSGSDESGSNASNSSTSGSE